MAQCMKQGAGCCVYRSPTMAARRRSRSASLDELMNSAEVAHAACTSESEHKRRNTSAELVKLDAYISATVDCCRARFMLDEARKQAVAQYEQAQRYAMRQWVGNPTSTLSTERLIILSHCINLTYQEDCVHHGVRALWDACTPSFTVPWALLQQMTSLQDDIIDALRSFAMQAGIDDLRCHMIHDGFSQKESVRRFLDTWKQIIGFVSSITSDGFARADRPSESLCNLHSEGHSFDWQARLLMKQIAKAFLRDQQRIRDNILVLPPPVRNLIERFTKEQ